MVINRDRKWRMLALGSNGSGQLGIGNIEDVAIPTICKFDQNELDILPHGDKPFRIVAGGNHTLILFQSGAVFGTGENHDGRLGLLPEIKQTSSFRRVHIINDQSQSSITDFTAVGATWEASFLVDHDGMIWVCGTGERGELGLGPEVKQSVPGTHNLNFSGQPVAAAESGLNFSCGMSHIVLSMRGGGTWGWGTSRKGQLGPQLRDQKTVWEPTKLNISVHNEHRSVTGRDFTLFIGADSGYSFLGDTRYIQLNEPQTASTVAAAGWSNVYFLANGLVHSFGRKQKGQLPPKNLPTIRLLASGSEHCVAVDTSDNVLAWGWGEHGNCGVPTDSRGNVAGFTNKLPVGLGHLEHVMFVAAGCATTFIVVEHDRS